MITVQDKWTLPVREFAAAMQITLATVIKTIALDLNRRIVMRTPVDTGRARASWDLSVGTPSTRVEPERTGKAGGGVQQTFTALLLGGSAEIVPAAAAAIDGTQPVFIVSNIPYIEALENGHSQQAPVGMVEISIVEIESELESILSSVNLPAR